MGTHYACNDCGLQDCRCPPLRSRPDTRHLDTAVKILKGDGAAKRATRKAQVELVATMVSAISYVITANGRIVDSGEGNMARARQLMNDRAANLKRMGKTVTVQEINHE